MMKMKFVFAFENAQCDYFLWRMLMNVELFNWLEIANVNAKLKLNKTCLCRSSIYRCFYYIIGNIPAERLTSRTNKLNPIETVTMPNCIVHRMANRQICRRTHDRTSQRIHSINRRDKKKLIISFRKWIFMVSQKMQDFRLNRLFTGPPKT